MVYLLQHLHLIGYKKDPNDKYHLIVDEESAQIVKKIFEMYAKGEGYHKIAHELNNTKVPCPSEYKRLHSSKYRCWTVDTNKVVRYEIEEGDTLEKLANKYYSSKKEIMEKNNLETEEVNVGDIIEIPSRPIWSNASVRHILIDEVYIGTLVQGKVEGISYKDKRQVKVPKEKWIRVPHCHTAIIDMELWNLVRNRFNQGGRNKPSKNGTLNIFSKKVYCDCCGKIFQLNRASKHDYLKCKRQRESLGRLCSNNLSIRVDKLEEIVLGRINEQITKYYDEDKIKKGYYEQKVNSSIEKDINILKEEEKTINKAINKKVEMLSLLYEDRATGIITANEFAMIKNKNNTDIEDLKERLYNISVEINELENKREQKINSEKIFKKYKKIKKLDRYILDEFISMIYIGELDEEKEERKIRIKWNITEY